MYKGKVKTSVMHVPDGQSPTLKLLVEKWDDCFVLSVMTHPEQYGSPEDVLAIEVMQAYGDLLDRRQKPHEKLYRRRLHIGASKGRKVVDGIRVDRACLPAV